VIFIAFGSYVLAQPAPKRTHHYPGGMSDLEHARRFALSLPEATEEPHFDKASFRVCGKIFATVPPDEAHLHVFVDELQVAVSR
jgi:hypothetical protein